MEEEHSRWAKQYMQRPGKRQECLGKYKTSAVGARRARAGLEEVGQAGHRELLGLPTEGWGPVPGEDVNSNLRPGCLRRHVFCSQLLGRDPVCDSFSLSLSLSRTHRAHPHNISPE